MENFNIEKYNGKSSQAIIDTTYGKETFTTVGGRNRKISTSADNRFLLSLTESWDYKLEMFELSTGIKQVLDFDDEVKLHCHAANKLLIAGHKDCRLYLYNLDDQTQVTNIEMTSPIKCLTISNDGEYIAVGLRDKEVVILDSQLAYVHSIKIGQVPTFLEFDLDAQWLAFSAQQDKTVRVYGYYLSKQFLLELKGVRGEINSLCWSDWGIHVSTNNKVCGWNIDKDKCKASKVNIHFSDKKAPFLVGAHEQGLIIHQFHKQVCKVDIASAEIIWSVVAYERFCLQGDSVFVGHFCNVYHIDAYSGEKKGLYQTHLFIEDIAVCQQSHSLFVSSASRHIACFNIKSGQQYPVTGVTDEIKRIVKYDDGFFSVQKGEVIQWKAGQAELADIFYSDLKGKNSSVDAFEFNQEHNQCWIGKWDKISLVDLITKEFIAEFKLDDCGTVCLIKVLNKDRLLVCSGHSRRSYGRLFILNSVTGEVLHFQKDSPFTYEQAIIQGNYAYLTTKGYRGYTCLDLRDFSKASVDYIIQPKLLYSRPHQYPSVFRSGALGDQFVEFGESRCLEERTENSSILSGYDAKTDKHLFHNIRVDKVECACVDEDARYFITAHSQLDEKVGASRVDLLRIRDFKTGHTLVQLELPRTSLNDDVIIESLHYLCDEQILVQYNNLLMLSIILPDL